MLEKMGEFFDNRLYIYDEHQLKCIKNTKEFMKFTASRLPKLRNAKILDLGCGTGLELEWYFKLNPTAEITGIDLASGMLHKLKEKLPDKKLNLIVGSYFDVDFGKSIFDGAVSVESIHHFTFEQKLRLYIKIYEALKDNCNFLLTDYFSLSDDEEREHFAEFAKLKEEENIADGELYHFDTPLTVEHECECLRRSGFEDVRVLNSWAQTFTIIAKKKK